jgi:Concanavalin A-like lectin/glucanases superfamily
VYDIQVPRTARACKSEAGGTAQLSASRTVAIGLIALISLSLPLELTGCGHYALDPIAKDQESLVVPDFLIRYPLASSADGLVASEPVNYGIPCSVAANGCPKLRLDRGSDINVAVGSAYVDGTGVRYQIPNTEWFGLSDYTVSVWVNPAPSNINGAVFSKPLSRTMLFDVLSIDAESRAGSSPTLGVVSSTNGEAAPMYVGTTKEVSFGKWIHLAARKTSQELVFYIDGARQLPVTVELNQSTLNAGFGADLDFDSIDWIFRGGMDDLRIYDRALLETEIVELATATAL